MGQDRQGRTARTGQDMQDVENRIGKREQDRTGLPEQDTTIYPSVSASIYPSLYFLCLSHFLSLSLFSLYPSLYCSRHDIQLAYQHTVGA
jgi:hypothetical protein